jgi:hypothetical protein
MNHPSPTVLTGYYGLGALFPLIVLDTAGWTQAAPTAVPEPGAAGSPLALRWCGPDAEEDAAPALLAWTAATSRVPASAADAAAYQDALPAHLRLVALPQSCITGHPWRGSPGHSSTYAPEESPCPLVLTSP